MLFPYYSTLYKITIYIPRSFLTLEYFCLRFRLLATPDSEYFNINKTNGVITASTWFEEKPSYSLKIEIRDQPLRDEDILRTEVKMNVYLAEELVAPIFDDITDNEVRYDIRL